MTERRSLFALQVQPTYGSRKHLRCEVHDRVDLVLVEDEADEVGALYISLHKLQQNIQRIRRPRWLR